MRYQNADEESNLTNTSPSADAGFMLAQRLRRWANINPALDHYQCVLFAGKEDIPLEVGGFIPKQLLTYVKRLTWFLIKL